VKGNRVTAYSEPGDPAALAAELTARADEATARLLRTAAGLTDDQARQPSLLPGWSRGHVLTHIARNADGLRNLLIWARTGVETPQYPSRESRAAGIEAGSGRSAAELAADITESAGRFAAEAREVPEDGWLIMVTASRGGDHPAWFTLNRRLSEVEVHHVDLAAGYTSADWAEEFVTDEMYFVIGALDDMTGTPAVVLTDSDSGRQFLLGVPPGTDPASIEVTVTGPGHQLLTWLLSRDDGAGLIADPAGPLPAVPAYG